MNIWVFWAFAAGLCAMIAVILWRALSTRSEEAVAQDIGIYRDQLAEVERDLARGTIVAEEADRLRIEVSRRLLEADRAMAVRKAAGARGNRVAASLLVAVTIFSAFGLYLHLGAPGYPDLPLQERISAVETARTGRPSQAQAEAQFPAAAQSDVEPDFLRLMDQLRAAVAENPEDAEGQRLLVRNEAAIGNFAAAATAQRKLMTLGPATAEGHSALAELLIMAAGGYVSPEAERELSTALAANPRDALSLYYSGLMMAQGGRDDLAFRFWRSALDHAPADAPYVPFISAQMPDIAARAGMRWDPASAPAPAGADAIASLPPEERDTAIRGMVEGLAARLASEGGPVEDWARLIRAYGVLGETDNASVIWTEARQRFNDDQIAPALDAALQAGVAE